MGAAASLSDPAITNNSTATAVCLPAKVKASNARANNIRFLGSPRYYFLPSFLFPRNRTNKSRFGAAAAAAIRFRVFAGFVLFFLVSSILLLGFARPFVGWDGPYDQASVSPAASRSGFTVLINTWKRNSLLKKTVAHYATCSKTEAIHVVWSERDPPPESLKAYLRKIVLGQSQNARKPNFRFELNEEDNLNNRFKPIASLINDAIFSVDDDVLVPCSTLNYAFTVWQTAPNTMVGFVPRMHWLHEEKDGAAYYKYGGWWSVWWTGTYSIILSKAAFFHQKYLHMYTNNMLSSVRDYVTRERNCEDLAMSFLVANATGAPPIWVRGKVHEIGSFGISSLKGHTEKRSKCLNDFINLYQRVPLTPTNMKAVDARTEWLW